MAGYPIKRTRRRAVLGRYCTSSPELIRKLGRKRGVAGTGHPSSRRQRQQHGESGLAGRRAQYLPCRVKDTSNSSGQVLFILGDCVAIYAVIITRKRWRFERNRPWAPDYSRASPTREGYQFRRVVSFRTSMSNAWSDTSFFNRIFFSNSVIYWAIKGPCCRITFVCGSTLQADPQLFADRGAFYPFPCSMSAWCSFTTMCSALCREGRKETMKSGSPGEWSSGS